MNINNFSIYSAISVNCENNNNDFEKVLQHIENFNKIDNIKNAKKYLEDNWQIDCSVSSYPIGRDCQINVKENEKNFSVNFLYKDENITYYYRK